MLLPMNLEKVPSVETLKAVKGDFVDYVYFQGDRAQRQQEKEVFLRDEKYVPHYTYPRLGGIRFNEEVRQQKADIYRTVELIPEDTLESPEQKLYLEYLDLRFKRILLVEAAEKLHAADNSDALDVARQSFMNMNREVYGHFNDYVYQSLIATEYRRAQEATPRGQLMQTIQKQLLQQLEPLQSGMEEQTFVSMEDMNKLRGLVEERYGDVLSVVPNTDASVYYDNNQCVNIMDNALEAGGLAQLGWHAKIDAAKISPSSSAQRRQIALPASTRRNADELRRLIIHEQEVHARRGENARRTGCSPLMNGTSHYADVEEGLGVLLECAVAGNLNNDSFSRARDRYITAGLALGSEDYPPRDARQTYEVLWRMYALRNHGDDINPQNKVQIAKNKAYTHIENAFRGTQFWLPGTIYTKLKVYYEGLCKNVTYMHERRDNLNEALDLAMLGKYDHTDYSERALVYRICQSKGGV